VIRPGPIERVNHDSFKAYQQIANRVTVTADYTVLHADDYILVDSTAGAVTVTLPTARNGLQFTILRTAGANNVTIVPSGAETINGAASVVINTSYAPQTFKDFTPLLTGYARIG
jgi:hypothetical protein